MDYLCALATLPALVVMTPAQPLISFSDACRLARRDAQRDAVRTEGTDEAPAPAVTTPFVRPARGTAPRAAR